MTTTELAAGNGRAHAKLSFSGAYRWMQCPGQPALTADMPNTSSWYAAEGTVAHHVGETALRENKEADHYIGRSFDAEVNGKPQSFTVTLEMAEAVQVYVDWVRKTRRAVPGTLLMLEKSVSLGPLTNTGDMWGTSDCIMYVPLVRLLIVADYKHGKGHAVEVADNPQLKLYGLAALVDIAKREGWKVDKVQTTIIQPRAPHPYGPIRSQVYNTLDLLEFAQDALDGAQRCADAAALMESSQVDGPYMDQAADEFRDTLHPGDWCKWCPAENTCVARVGAVQEVVPMHRAVAGTPNLALMSFDERAALLKRIEALDVEGFIASLRASVHADLDGGATHPDWKLVPKRASRVWAVPEAQVVAALKSKVAVVTDLYDMKLVTPAQAEKLVGKKEFPAELVTSVSSGTTLVPASDPRAAVTMIDAADEFDAIDPPQQ